MKKIHSDSYGATAIEYAFIAVLISISIIGVLQLIGQELQVPYTRAGTALQNANTANG